MFSSKINKNFVKIYMGKFYLIYLRFNIILSKVFIEFFLEFKKINLKFIWKEKL